MRFLSFKAHNVLDILVGLALILAPNIFGFSDVGGAAVMVPRVIGLIAIISGFTTKGWPYSFAGIFTPKLHIMMDLLAGIFLAASPWLFGFADEETNVWLPHLVVGLALVVVSLTTRVEEPAHRDAAA